VAAVAIAACLVAFAVSVMWTVRSVSRGYTNGIDGDSGSEGGGGGPGRGGGPDRPLTDVDYPVWWPQFEREFADYVTSATRR
jgi:hypothetical protein